MHDVRTVILGGGRGARLYPLTRHRAEPAVPLAGHYRLIDVPISNCLNSGLDRIYVVTQFLSVSLHRHLAATYKASPFSRGFVELLAAQQTNETADWYQGTADALRQNLSYFDDPRVRDVLVLSGDQLYRMDFRTLIEAHRARDADVTLAVTPTTAAKASNLGVVCLNGDDRIVDLVEKPQQTAQLERLRTPQEWLRRRGVQAGDRDHLVNMGIYLFRRRALFELLAQQSTAVDLVREVLAPNLEARSVAAHFFSGYWEDLGSIASYYEAHLALVGAEATFDFHSPDGVIYTHMRNLPAAHLGAATIEHCLLSDGCVVERGARLRRALIGLRGKVGAEASLTETILLGADAYETPAERAENRRAGIPDVGVGEGAVVEKAILDKGCRIGRRAHIVNREGKRDADGDNHVIRDGIVIVPRGAVVPEGAVI
jgi:glucose-1-phosphate adenylyltransferase